MKKTPTVFNHGALMPVKSDERNYVPKIGLLLKDGTVKLHPLDVSKDRWIDTSNMVAVAEQTGADVDALLGLFESLADAGADFASALRRYCTKAGVSKRVAKVLEETMEETQ